MEKLFEDAFDPNNKFHVKWLKDLVNYKEDSLKHNPFSIHVSKDDVCLQQEIISKLSRKFINSSVCYNFSNLFSYEYAYHNDGEYQKCRLLRPVDDFPKGAYFEYALVYPKFIDFYKTDDVEEPDLTIQRW